MRERERESGDRVPLAALTTGGAAVADAEGLGTDGAVMTVVDDDDETEAVAEAAKVRGGDTAADVG